MQVLSILNIRTMATLMLKNQKQKAAIYLRYRGCSRTIQSLAIIHQLANFPLMFLPIPTIDLSLNNNNNEKEP
jgi:hypothetical protein